MAMLSASSSSSPILDERRPPESSPPPSPSTPRKGGSKKKRKLPKLISFSEQQMKLAFSILDEDQDGLVTARELLAALRKLGLEDCVDERVAVSLLKDATKCTASSHVTTNKSTSASTAPSSATTTSTTTSTCAAESLEDELMSESQFLAWLPKLASYATPTALVPSSPVTPPTSSSSSGNLLTTVDADLKAAFAVFDKDKNGYISREELRSAMALMKEKVTDHELDQVMAEADLDHDGQISFDEFAKLMMR